MSAPPDDRVDVSALAAEGATVARRYGLDEFPRLADMLAGTGGEAEARFHFLQAATNVVGCELEVRAAVTLRCERCLEPYAEALRSTARLAFVSGGRGTGAVPEGFEELTMPAGRISLRELVEDELLLSMPLVARHGADDGCTRRASPETGGAGGPETGLRRPFSGLKELLKT